MAMTKREQATYDAAIKAAETVAALRWTEPVEPDLPVPERIGEHTQGWACNADPFLLFGVNSGVYEAWSTNELNGRGVFSGNYYNIGSRCLYSTKLRALLAVRHKAEQLVAERFRELDLCIRDLSPEQDAK